ncbi:MAG: IS66 family transposase [Pyrinomonadaceae bacterium]|nr:IS66 family transposase [Pyrinomonadaceae bacterium]
MTESENIVILEAENAELRQQIISLEEKVLLLLELQQKQRVKKDSGNSSLPPSSDIGRKTGSLRQRSGRSPGGQKGHRGNTLEMTATPDRIIDLKSNYCAACGNRLGDENFVLKARRQVLEIPPSQPIIEEYRTFACACPKCDYEQIADFPPAVKAPIQYGSSVQALVAYFSVYQYVPFRRLKNLFSEVFKLPLSEGTLVNLLEKSAEKSGFVYAGIKAEIGESRVVGSDETSARVDGKKWWMWVWQNVLNTFIVAAESRGSRTIEAEWSQGLQGATVVSDRWAAQLKMPSAGKQICLAHLLRDVRYLAEVEKEEFSVRFKRLLGTVFEIRQEMVRTNAPCEKEKAEELENQMNNLLAISINREKKPETARFQRSMIKYRNNLLPCLYDVEIPADNNGSERAIRNIKVKQKISGQFKGGQKTFCVLRSVIDTLIKRQLDVLTHLTQIMKIQPE